MGEAVTKNILIGGHVISVTDAMKLVDRIYAHAWEIAGQFYEEDRSAKFRVNWKSAEEYAYANRHAFVEQARAEFAASLANPRTDPAEAERILIALLAERAFAEGQKARGVESDTQLQVRKGTQQFDGDRYENKRIATDFGNVPNLRAKLKAGAAKIVKNANLH